MNFQEQEYKVYINGIFKGSHKFDTVFTANTDSEKNGIVFSYWERHDGVIMSYSTSYQFHVNENISLKAVYKGYCEPTPLVTTSTLVGITKTDTESKMSFMSRYQLPDGYTKVECGHLISRFDTGFTLESSNVTKAKSNNQTPQGEYMSSMTGVKPNAVRYGRGYLVYSDSSGSHFTIYAEIAKGVFPSEGGNTMGFNVDDLIIDRIRGIRTFDLSTGEVKLRINSVEDGSLNTSADGTEVTDSTGATIATLYKAQKAELTGTASLFHLGLAAEQWGSQKSVGSESSKITVPCFEQLTINSAVVTLKNVPTGVEGAEIKYVYVNDSEGNSTTYEISSTAAAGKFTLDTVAKTITFPEGTVGTAYVDYEYESSDAVEVLKTTDNIPAVQKVIADVIFRDKCDQNIVYAGYVVVPKAQLDPSSVEIALTTEGKHPFNFKINKDYCSTDGKLFRFVVAK